MTTAEFSSMRQVPSTFRGGTSSLPEPYPKLVAGDTRPASRYHRCASLGTTSPMRHTVGFVLILILPPGVGFARRPPSDAIAHCAATKLATTAAAARAELKCHGQAAGSGHAASPACLTGAANRIATQFSKAERGGGCEASGDAAAVATALAERIASAAAMVRPANGRSKCAGTVLRAAGQGAQTLYKARAKQRLRVDLGRLAAARAQVRARLQQVVAKAGTCGASDAAALVALPEQIAGLAGTLFARLQAAKATRIGRVSQPDILSQRDALAAQGLTVADDGSLLTSPPQPAGGWLLRLGDRQGRSDSDGLLTIDVSATTALEGEVFHPSDATFVVGHASLNDLVAGGETPRTMGFLITNNGPCGMDEDAADDPAACHSAGALAAGLANATANPDPASFPPIITTPVGTYPNPDPNARQRTCADTDGPLPDVGPLAYPGSTCHAQVTLGCCDNEQADIVRIGLTLIDSATFPLLHCKSNHRGRLCQSVRKGDISVQVRGDILKTGNFGRYEVAPSEVVHSSSRAMPLAYGNS